MCVCGRSVECKGSKRPHHTQRERKVKGYLMAIVAPTIAAPTPIAAIIHGEGPPCWSVFLLDVLAAFEAASILTAPLIAP